MSKLDALIQTVLDGEQYLGPDAARVARQSLEGELDAVQGTERWQTDPAYRNAVRTVREGMDTAFAGRGDVPGGDMRGAKMSADEIRQGFHQLRYVRADFEADPGDGAARERYETAARQLEALTKSWEAANGQSIDAAIDMSALDSITDYDLARMREAEEAGERWEDQEHLAHLVPRYGNPAHSPPVLDTGDPPEPEA